MKITLKDGYVKEYGESKSVYEIALDISEGLARGACCAKVNGEVVDLRTVLDKDCELQICTANDEEGLATIRHTASHVLAEAVKNLFPDAKLTIGPSIDTGFYYDFDHAPFSREDLDNLDDAQLEALRQRVQAAQEKRAQAAPAQAPIKPETETEPAPEQPEAQE